ncbi:hypothetical protein BU17DRAFT_58222, partial [Hysterangium stoloniferum]
GVRAFTRSSLGCYLMSLLFCDFLQGSAFTLNYRWAAQGVMNEGKFCTVQGLVSEIGDLGAALWLLFLVKKPHFLAAPIVLTLGWSTLIILPIVGPTLIQTTKRGSFFGLSGAWCWVGVGYGTERLLYLYVWVFSALFTSFVIYTLIYLRFANFITIGDKGRFVLHFRRTKRQDVLQSNTSDVNSARSPALVSKHLKQVARRLMWYPILYAIVVLPVSICRMGVLAGWTPPFEFFVFAGICFSGSGFTNAILFIFTRHSFIRKVAKSHGTRIHVTTQRITVGEDGVDVELSNIGTAGTSPATLKSPYFLNNDSDSPFPGEPTEKRAKFEDDSECENKETDITNVHLSVFGQ